MGINWAPKEPNVDMYIGVCAIHWGSNRDGMHTASALIGEIEATQKPRLVELKQCACPNKACLVERHHTALESWPPGLLSKTRSLQKNLGKGNQPGSKLTPHVHHMETTNGAAKQTNWEP